MTDIERHTRLIDALGGGTVVAGLLSEVTGETVPRNRVYQWRIAGIPWRMRVAFARLATARDIALPPGFLGVESAAEARVG